MAPRRRRAQKVGLKRIDAALNAMRAIGFAPPLVRKTIKNLLEAYGGDEGWTFIEEGSYQLLVDSILEEKEKMEAEKPKLFTDGSSKDDDADDQTTQVPSSCGPSKQIHSPDQMDLSLHLSTTDASTEKLGTHEANLSSSKLAIVRVKEEKLDEFPLSEICLMFNSPKKLGANDANPSTSKAAIVPYLVKEEKPDGFPTSNICSRPNSMRLSSITAANRRPHWRCRPSFGWVDSEEDEEPDIVYTMPTTTARTT